MSKSKLKIKLQPARQRGRTVVQLKARAKKQTEQQTIRLPVAVLDWLKERAAGVRPEPITVSFAIRQIVEDEFKRDAAKSTV